MKKIDIDNYAEIQFYEFHETFHLQELLDFVNDYEV